MNPEIKGRFVALLTPTFIITMLVLIISVILLIKNYIGATEFAAVVTGGIFAHNITPNVAQYESYAEKVLGKGAGWVAGKGERDDKMAD